MIRAGVSLLGRARSWPRPRYRDVSPAQTPKAGLLTLTQRGPAPGLRHPRDVDHLTVWPAMPCFSNLVLFDPLKATESADTIIGELAEKWSWQDGYRNLVFFLRRT